jgi:hypothetical protein
MKDVGKENPEIKNTPIKAGGQKIFTNDDIYQ